MSDEYIKKGPLMKFIEDGLNNRNPEKAFGHDAIEIMTEIQFTPAAPVREVVTCGECERWKEVETGMGVCISGTCEACVTSADFFCADGKRPDMRAEEGGPT